MTNGLGGGMMVRNREYVTFMKRYAPMKSWDVDRGRAYTPIVFVLVDTSLASTSTNTSQCNRDRNYELDQDPRTHVCTRF